MCKNNKASRRHIPESSKTSESADRESNESPESKGHGEYRVEREYRGVASCESEF